ncbi:hypothetical protein GPECTOR_19g270 [Gonium pectorale]|uniref:Uncharacterized protein n=1 Tax=Gonium pectorale TaxID=33097 RepID=A0A150GJ49_GONPE|nr:hypothetical protein GPECTOR_19g270 [Gonium pectorale]|eukprot:KXZ49819.1 hypothetical protein GPECTOR_19g270 [Gonium pectorale]
MASQNAGGAPSTGTNGTPPHLPVAPERSHQPPRSQPLGFPRPPPAPLALFQPLVSAVVAATGGRLRSLPPALVAWLLRAATCAGHHPQAAWLAEAYGALAARVGELQPDQAAQAFLAIASLATGIAPAVPNTLAECALPPTELLSGLYRRLALAAGPSTGGGSSADAPRSQPLDPRAALACLEAAAACEWAPGGAAAASAVHARAVALVSNLEALLPQLDAVQISYCMGAVCDLVAEPAASAFVRGAAAAALAARIDGLSAPRLAESLAALPPPLAVAMPAELAAAAHGALRGCLAEADSDDLTEVLRRLGDADALPGYGWQGALAAEAGARMGGGAAAAAAAPFPSQELCNTLFLLAALNYRPAFSWTATAAAALQPRLLTLGAAQLTNALWALAKFGYRGEGAWGVAAVQALQLQLPDLAPHQLSYGLGSLQRMGCHVGPAVLDEMLEAAAVQLASYPPSDLVLLLMTVTRLRHVPSYAFTEAVTERLRPHLAATVAAAAEELASVGYALAKLHSRPEADWMAAYMTACRDVMPSFSADLLASLLWAVGELGQAPSPDWLSAFLASSRPLLGEFAPQDLVSLLSSLAALRAPPPADWLGEALTALGARVGGLDGQAVAALLKALVDLDARVSNPEWYEALCSQVSAFLPLLAPGALVDLVSSLGTLGHSPSREWLDRCCAAAVRVQAQAVQASSSAAAAAAAASNGGGYANGGGNGSGGGYDSGVRAEWAPGGAGAAGGNAGGLGSAQLEALVCGLARLGAEPPASLLQAFFASSAPALAAQPPQRVAATASALAGAKVAPEPAWLDALAAAVRANVMSYTFVQLDALARALAVFQGLVPEHKATRDLLSYLREFCLYG